MNRKRIYNIFFHLHTVSGIVISSILFILFFAGAFTMFKEKIEIWENKPQQRITLSQIDFDKAYQKLNNQYNLLGRNINFYSEGDTNFMYIYLDHSHAPNASEIDLKTERLKLNLEDYAITTEKESYTYAQFIYELHYLHPIPIIGKYLAGFVSLFFLFALITGLYIHWDKISKNFVLFRPYSKWKTVWTDAHTVLGTIAFPFQLIFAVTGAYFCLSALVLLPVYNLYNNDAEKMMQDLRPERSHAAWEGEVNKNPLSINQFVNDNQHYYDHFEIQQVSVENIGGSNMTYRLVGELDPDIYFNSIGGLTANAYNLEVLDEFNPIETPYVSGIQRLIVKLHFGEFGGTFNKIIYALLAFMTCFIIISGVMIWFTARSKKNNNKKPTNFHFQVAHIYLAVCMGMLPTTALGFIWARSLSIFSLDGHATYYKGFYFITWLLLSLYFIFKKDMQFTNKGNLILGGILFMLVPLADVLFTVIQGIHQNLHIFSIINLLCLTIGLLCLYSYYRIKTNSNNIK